MVDQLFKVVFPQQTLYVRPGKGAARITKAQASSIMIDGVSAFIKDNIEYYDLDEVEKQSVVVGVEPVFGDPAAVSQQEEETG